MYKNVILIVCLLLFIYLFCPDMCKVFTFWKYILTESKQRDNNKNYTAYKKKKSKCKD